MPETQNDLQYGDYEDKLNDLFDEILNIKFGSTAFSNGGPGTQYGLIGSIGGLVGGILRTTAETLEKTGNLIEGIMKKPDNIAHNIINEIENNAQEIGNIIGDSLKGGQERQYRQVETAGFLKDIKNLWENGSSEIRKTIKDTLNVLSDSLNKKGENIKDRIGSIIGN